MSNTDPPSISTGQAGNIESTLPVIYAMIVIFGALVVVWIVGVILSCAYKIMDSRVVRPTREKSQSRGGGNR